MVSAQSTPESRQDHPVALSRDGQPILFPSLPYAMKGRSESFARDTDLQARIARATHWLEDLRRTETASAFGANHDAVRELGGSIKQHTLDHLDYYLEKFTASASAAGAEVHFARDTDEANAIALDIARHEKCTLCVKSKSMVTEEMHLLPKLEAAGVETWETDLGEFIQQIGHDAPSHIIAPIIHMDKRGIAQALHRELGVPYTEEPRELAMAARKFLREKFRRADLGISGGNFLVADTGSVVIVTNEGNGRYCTSAPRVYIACVGIEKMVPGLEHLGVLLKLLARHATGQKMSVYTHMLTGPKRRGEHDGPEKMHYILVDAGRTNLLRDERYREALRCLRCGACLNVCPVYRKVTGHAYGSVYSGPIGAVVTPLLKGLENYKDLPNASSLCGACYQACPVKINLPELLITLRNDMIRLKLTGWRERAAYKLFAMGLSSPLMYRLGGWAQRKVLPRLADQDGFIRRGPGPVKPWTEVRDLPAPAGKNFRSWWKTRSS